MGSVENVSAMIKDIISLRSDKEITMTADNKAILRGIITSRWAGGITFPARRTPPGQKTLEVGQS